METLSLLDTVIRDWKIIAAAFTVGALYWQVRLWFKKITALLENTGLTHGKQNIVLDSIHDKIDNLDRRMSKLEGSLEMVNITNHEQSVRLSIIETHQEIDNQPPRKRRQRVQ